MRPTTGQTYSSMRFIKLPSARAGYRRGGKARFHMHEGQEDRKPSRKRKSPPRARDLAVRWIETRPLSARGSQAFSALGNRRLLRRRSLGGGIWGLRQWQRGRRSAPASIRSTRHISTTPIPISPRRARRRRYFMLTQSLLAIIG